MSNMRIVTTGPEGVPGAEGLAFGRGTARDDDGNEVEVYNPYACPIAADIAIVAGRVHISRWVGEAWCVLTIGCKVNPGEHPAKV